MSDIRDILALGRSQRLEEPTLAPDDVERLVQELQAPLPAEYLEFLALGGVAELRFKNLVLAPAAIVAEYHWVQDLGLVPVAGDGCGNLYCWRRADLPSSIMYLWDHESGEVRQAYGSLTEALRAWRF